jgi:hypothetical protein
VEKPSLEEKENVMKRFTRVLVIVMVVGCLIWCMGIDSSISFAGEPAVVNGTPVVKMDKKKTFVDLYGTGFQSGQEIRILFTTADGVQADIGYALKPAPKPDEGGNWVTRWNASRFVSKKLIKAGTYAITVADGKYNTIATVPVCFYAEKKAKKKK